MLFLGPFDSHFFYFDIFYFKLNLFLFSGQIGTAEKAKQRVRSYFQGLRDQLNRQEVAALTVVETYIRERLCFIRLLETFKENY
jgi:hypothetical protein